MGCASAPCRRVSADSTEICSFGDETLRGRNLSQRGRLARRFCASGIGHGSDAANQSSKLGKKSCGVLLAHHADNQAYGLRRTLLQLGQRLRDRFGASRIVRTVEPQLRAWCQQPRERTVVQSLHARRPTHFAPGLARSQPRKCPKPSIAERLQWHCPRWRSGAGQARPATAGPSIALRSGTQAGRVARRPRSPHPTRSAATARRRPWRGSRPWPPQTDAR